MTGTTTPTTNDDVSSPREPTVGASRSQVLILDDQPARALAYEAILAGLVDCVRAPADEHLLDRFMEREFAAILLDLTAQPKAGLELARVIAEQPQFKTTPIVLIADAHFAEFDGFDATGATAMDCIAIPVVPGILRGKVALLVELHQARRSLRVLADALREARAQAEAERVRARTESESQRRAIFEHPTDRTVVLEALRDTDGRIVDWIYLDANRNTLALLGRTRETLIGRRLSEVLSPERAQHAGVLCAKVLDTRKPIRYESRFGDADFLITIFPIDANAVVSSGVDISNTKRTAAALRESEERLRLIYQSSGIGAWEWRADTNEVYWSPEYREIYGLDLNEPPTFDRGIESTVLEDRPHVLAEVQRALAERRVFRSEHRVLHPRKGLRWITAIGQTFCDDAGRPLRMLGIVIDVTERRLAEEALKEADARKDQFIATLAHELRNPLAPIRNGVRLLRTHELDLEARAKVLDMVDRQSTHLVRLVDDLLDVSRISRGHISLRRDALDLVDVVNTAVETSRPIADAARHRLTLRIPNERIVVMGDAVRLAQVISNVLNNAAKYTNEGGEIVLTVRRENTEAVISVRDNGIGIAREDLPRIFEMFAQATPAGPCVQGGLGIGLSLARTLIELHGGAIMAESDGPGTGAEVSVRLPLPSQSDIAA